MNYLGSGVGSSPVSGKPNDVVMESNTNPPTPASVMQVDTGVGSNGGGGMVKSESTTMLCEPTSPADPAAPSSTVMNSPNGSSKLDVELDLEDSDAITENDLQLICDLFYLPCEHGPEVIYIF